MSRDAMIQIVERACTDAAFRAQLVSNPEGALVGYDLTPEEVAILHQVDPAIVDSLSMETRASMFDPRQEQDSAMDWLKGLMP
jgi:hypothetical protein